MKKLKRCRGKERPWVGLKSAFWIPGYIVTSTDGTKYLTFAHNMSYVDYQYGYSLGMAYETHDAETHFEKRPMIRPWFKNDGTDNIHHRPFWYYHRVYVLGRDDRDA